LNPEPESIISFAIARAIREQPEQAAAEMLKLIRAQASLQAELFFLREKLRELAGVGM
jgi:hypothetical protein